jgi:hypothetical protein
MTAVTDPDPHKLTDALEQAARELERDSSELQEQIDDARADWQRKRADEGVPGAPPPAGQGPDSGAPSVEPPETSGRG